MNKTITKGTCGACFDSIALDKNGKLKRHGWKEYGRGRRVGEYGNVYHSGPCFGTRWLPYEVSDRCTIAFLGQYVVPAGISALTYCNFLAARPERVYSGRWFAVNETWARESGVAALYRNKEWNGYCDFSVRLVDGDPSFDVQLDEYVYHTTTVPSYDDVLASDVSVATMKYNAILADARRLYKAIADWQPAEVKAVEKKGKLVHTFGKMDRYTRCGRRVVSMYGVRLDVTKDETHVTCPKCKAA